MQQPEPLCQHAYYDGNCLHCGVVMPCTVCGVSPWEFVCPCYVGHHTCAACTRTCEFCEERMCAPCDADGRMCMCRMCEICETMARPDEWVACIKCAKPMCVECTDHYSIPVCGDAWCERAYKQRVCHHWSLLRLDIDTLLCNDCGKAF